jgi:hypothetical protein
MADKKISQLTGATTPLAGTEILPIVQGGNTVKVTVDNLTTGKAVSTGNLTVTGTLTGSTGILNIGSGQIYKDAQGNTAIGTTAPEGLFNVTGGASPNARQLTVGYGSTSQNYYTANTHTWLSGSYSTTMELNSTSLTLTNRNLVVGTSGKGIDFSATAGTGTSELLADYEEGTWTPVIAGSVTPGTYDLAASISTYTKIGRQVTVSALITTAGSFAGGGTGDFTITGLPFSKSADQRAFAAVAIGGMSYTAGGVVFASFGGSGASSVLYFTLSVSGTGATLLPISLVGGSNFIGFTLSYNA